MTQKQRSLALLGGVAAAAGALGLYAWFGVFQTNKAKEEAKTASDTLFSFKKEQIQKLQINSHGQTVEAALTDGGWEIESPIKGRADKVAFDNITEKLAGLKQKRDVGDQTDLSQFGLTSPRIKVVATLTDGSTHELEIGGDNSYDNTVFAKVGDSKRVSILEAGVKFPLDKGLFELRDKRVLAFDDAQLKHLDVAVPGFAYGLDRINANQWKVTAPQPMDGDSQKAQQIVNALRNLRATRFASDVASQADLSRYGLDKPNVTVELQLDKDDVQKTLTFSKQTEGKTDHTYVKVADEPFIAEVAGQIEKDLTVTLADLRDKTVLSFDQGAAKALKFEAGETKFEARKSGGGDAGPEAWTLVGGRAAKKWKLSSILSQLHDLKGSTIVTEKADAKAIAAAGLDKPSKTVTVLGDDGKVFGKLLVGKTEGPKINVKVEDSPKIYLIDSFKVTNLPASEADLAEVVSAADGGVHDAGVSTAQK